MVTVLDAGTPPAPTDLHRSDIRVDTFRATGPGGQHRNKTSSGVRLTHLPTGTVVTATEDRSQHVNRDVAWHRLQARLNGLEANARHEGTNTSRRADLAAGRTFTWTGWRDEVRTPDGHTTNMTRALRGDLGRLIG